MIPCGWARREGTGTYYHINGRIALSLPREGIHPPPPVTTTEAVRVEVEGVGVTAGRLTFVSAGPLLPTLSLVYDSHTLTLTIFASPSTQLRDGEIVRLRADAVEEVPWSTPLHLRSELVVTPLTICVTLFSPYVTRPVTRTIHVTHQLGKQVMAEAVYAYMHLL